MNCAEVSKYLVGAHHHDNRTRMALDLQTRKPATKDESPSVDDIDDVCEAKREDISLQEAFLLFRKKKQVQDLCIILLKFQEVPIISLLTLASLHRMSFVKSLL